MKFLLISILATIYISKTFGLKCFHCQYNAVGGTGGVQKTCEVKEQLNEHLTECTPDKSRNIFKTWGESWYGIQSSSKPACGYYKLIEVGLTPPVTRDMVRACVPYQVMKGTGVPGEANCKVLMGGYYKDQPHLYCICDTDGCNDYDYTLIHFDRKYDPSTKGLKIINFNATVSHFTNDKSSVVSGKY